MKRIFSIILIMGLVVASMTACTGEKDAFSSSKPISVISREDGSGTRVAFTEIFQIVEKDKDGNSKDMTTKEAIIAR